MRNETIARGHPDEAALLLEQVMIDNPGDQRDGVSYMLLNAATLYSLGDEQAAALALDEFIGLFGESQPVRLASLYAWRNEHDEAVLVLERVAASDDYVDQYELRSPLFASMYDDPVYRRLAGE